MKISLVGSFNLADGYLGAARALERLKHKVEFIPAHLYFNQDGSKKHLWSIVKDLRDHDSDVVLWWRSETLNAEQLKIARQEIEGKFILFSWDDPHQWESQMNNISAKCKYFDICFSCCEGSLRDYLHFGAKKAVYCLPGYDKEVHFPEEDDKFKCDVSLVCTNLYHGTKITKFHHISRKMLIEKIIDRCPDLDIRIYGPQEFGKLFGDRYGGWAHFDESRKIFHNSKINISTHIRPDGFKYLNERVGQILGSKGLLFVDQVNGIEHILENGKDCVYMDVESDDSIVSQVKNIIANYEDYESIKQSGYEKSREILTWDVWAKTVIDSLEESNV